MEKYQQKIIIEVSGEDWKEVLDKAFAIKIKEVKIAGFRDGKVPKDIYIKKYGIESLFEIAVELASDIVFDKLYEKTKDLEIVADHDITIPDVNETKVVFEFLLYLRPDVVLGQYKGLNIKKEEVVITDEEVERNFNKTLENYSEEVIKDGELSVGNIAVIDFEGFKDDVFIDGTRGNDYSLLLGSNTFIPGFEEQLIGLKKGDKKEFNINFPDEYLNNDLSGQSVLFKVEVKEVKEKIMPILNKSFFDDFGLEGIDTEDKLRKQIKENIQAEKEKVVENKYIDERLKEIINSCDVKIHDKMVEYELDQMLKNQEEELKLQGLTLEQFCEFVKTTREQLRDSYRDDATERVKLRLILEEIIKVENIKISDDEVEAELKKLCDNYNASMEEILNFFGNKNMIKYDLEMRKALDIIKE